MNLWSKLIVLVVLTASGCSPAVHEAVESMPPGDRSNWIAAQSAQTLCGGYQKPWAQPATKLMIEAELVSRGYNACEATRLGQNSAGMYKKVNYNSYRNRSQQGLASGSDIDCRDFSSSASAQKFFLSQGGPSYDPHRLDADGDGLACEWGADISRIWRGNSRSLQRLYRSSRISNKKCYTGPRGGTYTLTASGNKNYGGC